MLQENIVKNDSMWDMLRYFFIDVDVDIEDLRAQAFASMPASYTRSTMLIPVSYTHLTLPTNREV